MQEFNRLGEAKAKAVRKVKWAVKGLVLEAIITVILCFNHNASWGFGIGIAALVSTIVYIDLQADEYRELENAFEIKTMELVEHFSEECENEIIKFRETLNLITIADQTIKDDFENIAARLQHTIKQKDLKTILEKRGDLLQFELVLHWKNLGLTFGTIETADFHSVYKNLIDELSSPEYKSDDVADRIRSINISYDYLSKHAVITKVE